MDILNFVGSIASIIGVGGLLIALIQLWRTQKAAEAAKTSANQTLERISGIVGVASIEQICNRSRQLLFVLGTDNLSGSAIAAFELSESLARFSRSKAASDIQSDEAWKTLLAMVAEVHDALDRAAAIRRIDEEYRKFLVGSIRKIHSQLSSLTGVAGDKAGGF